jgi:dTDP-4-amino-4,6-dideoxygalactose transaminase
MNIPYHKAYIEEQEIKAVIEVLKSGWLTMGPKTIEFENNFKEFLGVKNSIAVNSATSALHLALKAIGIKEGDEVIIPTNTFIATAEVVTYFNAIPVLCDIEKHTHNIDVLKLESLITDKTKAIIPVHFAGLPCDMDEILAIAKKYNLKVIEDAAHAIPAKYKGKKIGGISDITCFSFYATKTLVTGEGGMATTSNADYAKCMKVNRLHGISRDAWDRYTTGVGTWYYEVVDNGYKYNMADMNAALGVEQLKKVEWMRDEREKIARKYAAAFKDTNVEIIDIPDDRESAYHLYVIKVNNRDELMAKLTEKGVGVSVHFIPIHKHPYYKEKYGYQDGDYHVANKVFDRSLSLPIYPGLSDEEIDYVISKVLEFVK